MTDTLYAPGWPGIPPRWTSSAKTGVGTALNQHSKIWFTTSHGIVNEVYFPRVDQACTRDLGFMVTNGRDFFSEEKRHCTFENIPFEPGVPAFELTNTEINGRYRIHKEILTDPYRNVLLQKIRFEPLQGQLSDYRLYALLSPHLANCGAENTAWVGDYKGVPMFLAEHNGTALAFACSVPWKKMSVGFVGASDGWQDLSAHFQMQWEYQRAENGNVACTGEIDLAACNGEFILALGFGSIVTEAGQQVRSTLFENYNELRQHYVFHWKNWQNTLIKLDEPLRANDLYRASTGVLRTHESKDFLGGIIASLSIPWGFSKGDEDLGGYHLIWPRDLVETAGALLAAGAVSDAVRVLRYLEATQEAAGNWAQNLWLDGRPYWGGIQMDETAFPILLLDLLRREAAKGLGKLERWWPMVRKAASFIVRNGPGNATGSMGRRRRIFALYSRRGNFRPSRSSRHCRTHRPQRHRLHSSRSRRRLERQYRTLGLRHRRRPRPTSWRRGLLRPHRAAYHRCCCLAYARLRPHQESSSRSRHGACLSHRES